MISAADYKSIADYVDDYVSDVLKAQTQLLNIHTTLGEMLGDDDNKANVDYAVQLSAFYLGSLGANPKDLITAVRSLNNNVVTNYGDLNTFLSSNNLSVKQHFADISALSGYTINVSNIG